MNNYHLSFVETDIPYIIEAIGLRSIMLQESIRMQVKNIEETRRRDADAERRAALPDPFDAKEPITIKASEPQQEEKKSRKQKRAALMRVLNSKASAELSTAEIARRAGVSYVTAMKARAALTPKKGRK